MVGRTVCGKTTFVHNLGKNNLFGDISEVSWVSKIVLSEEREDIIRDFNYLIQNFMQIKSDYVNIELGEDMVIDRLILMDDVSGLADKSDSFASFFKNWIFVLICFSYNLSKQTKLGDNNG